VVVHIPTLAERPVDIPLLGEHFLKNFCRSHNRNKAGITEKAMQCLARYTWPGNVRELENVIERAVILSKGPYIDVDDLPPAVVNQCLKFEDGNVKPASLKQSLEGPERAILRAALEMHHWNRQDTAAALQINRTTLYKKMKRYGLEDEAARLGL
jgi:DNA-binding NtrC family response regulator